MKYCIFFLIYMTAMLCDVYSQVSYEPGKNRIVSGEIIPYKTGTSVTLKYTGVSDKTIIADYKANVDPIAKAWLTKALELKEILEEPTRYMRYIKFLEKMIGLDIGEFKPELDKWIAYLKDGKNNYTNKPNPFPNYFPELPSLETFKKNYNDFYKVTSTTLEDNSTLVSASTPATSYLQITKKDLEKEVLLQYYNSSIRTELYGLEVKKLRKQYQELIDAIDEKTEGILRVLDDTLYNYASVDCPPLSSSLAAADKYKEEMDRLLGSNPMVKLMNNNRSFFQKWLWYSPGKIMFNPLPFTDPEEFLPVEDPMLYSNAALFDSLAAAKLKCNSCAISLDTLQYLISQQRTGVKRFSIDSLRNAQVESNKIAFDNFTKTKTLIYQYEYPYRRNGDSRIAVHAFDAGSYFTRTDVFGAKFNKPRQWMVNNHIPVNRSAAVFVYNIPSTMEVKVTANQVDTVIQPRATVEINNITTQLAGMATLLSPQLTAISGILDAVNSKSYRSVPTIQANLVTGPAKSIVPATDFSGTLDGSYSFWGDSTVIPNKNLPLIIEKDNYDDNIDVYYSVSVLDTVFKVRDNSCMTCGNGKFNTSLKEAIARFIVYRSNTVCADNVIDAFVKKFDPDCCKWKTEEELQCCVNNMIALFTKDLNDAINKVNTRRKDVRGVIKTYLENSIVPGFIQMKNLQGLPEQIEESEAAIIAAKYKYAKLHYMPAFDLSKTAVRVNYTVLAKEKKDTSFYGYFARSKRKYYMAGAGFVHTFGNRAISKAVTENPATFSVDDNAWRFIAGLHIYPAGILLSDNRSIFHKAYGDPFYHRLSIFLGVGIPKPLQNFYSGLGADIFPGLRLNTGARWAYDTKYQVSNNQVTGKKSGLVYGGWYLGLSVEPAALAGVLNIF